MKQFLLMTLLSGILLLGCNQSNTKTTSVNEKKLTNSTSDKAQIQYLIRQVLNWADTTNSIDLLPVVADSKDSVYIGFDLDKHKQNLIILRQTNLFATEFIDNYNQIILALDNGLRNGKYSQWFVGELPTFNFGCDVNPWTLSQDVPYENPNPYDFVEIILLNAEKGEVIWKWGKAELITTTSWKEFEYRFKVVKENEKWKISYLEGFDFKQSIR
jgi:hypothetical protein